MARRVFGKANLRLRSGLESVDYTITGMAANAAIAAVNDQQHVDRVVKLNAAQRQLLFDEMKRLKFAGRASQVNLAMINIRTPVPPVIPEFGKLKVLVGREFPALPTFLRVTLGTADAMTKFFVAFQEIFRS
jgi:histidinol-phosphate aminotransferase